MNLARHYQTLGLRRGASSREVKAAYRNLVRQYHPDINPDETAIEQFLKINDAYTALSESLRAHEIRAAAKNEQPDQSEDFERDGRLNDIRQTLEKLGLGNFQTDFHPDQGQSEPDSRDQGNGDRGDYPDAIAPEMVPLTSTQQPADLGSPGREAIHSGLGVSSDSLSAQEQSLKQDAYQQLKDLLRQQKFPRAIALVEGLAHRMPKDNEVIQWQAIVYQRWARKLIGEGQPQKARLYLKKALRTDPHNQSLWREINRDFWQLANLDNQSG